MARNPQRTYRPTWGNLGYSGQTAGRAPLAERCRTVRAWQCAFLTNAIHIEHGLTIALPFYKPLTRAQPNRLVYPTNNTKCVSDSHANTYAHRPSLATTWTLSERPLPVSSERPGD